MCAKGSRVGRRHCRACLHALLLFVYGTYPRPLYLTGQRRVHGLLLVEDGRRSLLHTTSSCAPRVFRRASQGPRRPCSAPPGGGARQGPIAGYVLQSAAPAGPSPWVYRGVHHRQYTAPFCLGVGSFTNGYHPVRAATVTTVSRLTVSQVGLGARRGVSLPASRRGPGGRRSGHAHEAHRGACALTN